MNRSTAEEDLELIRTMMERTTRYELLSARAGLKVGGVAVLGSLAFRFLDPASPFAFGSVWGTVFALSLLATAHEQAREAREAGQPIWTRPARQIVLALLPALTMAGALTVHAFQRGRHLELPGIWMLCYGCGALATSTYAPPVVGQLGLAFLVMGAVTLGLDPGWSTVMMGLAFGGGHLALAARLASTRRQPERQVDLKVV